MSTRLRRVLMVLGVLVAILAPAYWWFIVESGTPPTGRFSIDLNEVRRLADSIPGPLATEVRSERVAAFDFPATAIVAGDGWAKTEMSVYAYQLVFPDRRVIVDTGMDEKTANSGGGVFFDTEAFARVGRALGDAETIVVTHEHFDHLAGLISQPNAKVLLAKAKLTKEQLDRPDRLEPLVFPAGLLEGYSPISYERYLAIAPGVVLIKSPGHTPGSQLVYARRADGTEYLFLGDVAWQLRNVELVRERARLVTQVFLQEDREGVLAQLAELHRLGTEQPALQLVPGHDGKVVDGLVASGALIKGFAAELPH